MKYYQNKVKIIKTPNNQIFMSNGFEVEEIKTEEGIKFIVTEKYYRQPQSVPINEQICKNKMEEK